MRTLNVDALALLARIEAGERIPVVQLVQLVLTETIYLTTAGRAISWGGHSWLPAGLGAIEPIEDVTGDVQALQFSLPGISAEQIAIALTEPVEGDMTYDQCRAAWPNLVFWANINVGLYDQPPEILRQAVIDRRRRAGKRGFAFEISEDLPKNWKESIPIVLDAMDELD